MWMWCTSGGSGRGGPDVPRRRPRGGQGRRRRRSAVLGALGARGGVAGGGHALDRSDLVGGDRRGLGGGLRQLGRGGGGVATGQELALPVGQRLVATDDGLG